MLCGHAICLIMVCIVLVFILGFILMFVLSALLFLFLLLFFILSSSYIVLLLKVFQGGVHTAAGVFHGKTTFLKNADFHFW